MKPFDPFTAELTGTHLVEASAGTGKTYSIQSLYLRLLLEQKFSVREILVLTYTEAAAAELRKRIHKILTDACQFLQGMPTPDENDRLTRLLANCDVVDAKKRLSSALLDFDEARISTIHGFCHATLNEFAFESGVLFQTELVKDCDDLLNTIAGDFCRELFYTEHGMLRAELLAAQGINRDSLRELAQKFTGRNEVRLLGRPTRTRQQIEPELFAALQELAELWNPEPLIALQENLKSPYSNPDKFDALLRWWGDYAAGKNRIHREYLRMATPCALLNATRSPKGDNAKAEAKALTLRTVGAPFFQLAQKCVEQIEGEYLLCVRCEMIDRAATLLPQRKAERSTQTFDDLIRKVHHAVGAPDGRLVTALRKTYKAAILDEFQDTDPAQYEIFKAVFSERQDAAFYMVGDPKQAIYGFRGGDIATYNRAKRECPSEPTTLNRNFRSSAKFIDDLNTLYMGHRNPFAAAISYAQITAGNPDRFDRLNHAPQEFQGIKIRRIDGPVEACLEKTAEEIANLLSRTPDLCANEIAVLVYRSTDALLARKFLTERNIPAVFTKTGNIFHSPEAAELALLLDALAAPGNTTGVVRFLASALVGMSDEQLAELKNTPAKYAVEREEISELASLFDRGGFVGILERVLRRNHARVRILAQQGGERKLGNYLQLGDLLEEKRRAMRLAPEALRRFLAEAIRDSDQDHEEYEELLETDRDAVRIMTIHGSKGLEFPFVFLPDLFVWGAKTTERMRGTVSGPEGPEYDLCDSPKFQHDCEIERFQELQRLAYVAITRAGFGCIISSGKHKNNEKTSPLCWLLSHRNAPENLDNPVDYAMQNGALETTDCMRFFVPPEPVATDKKSPLPGTGKNQTPLLMMPRPLPERIDGNWRFTSFSALAAPHFGRTPDNGDSYFDYDADNNDPAGSSSPRPGFREAVFDLPGGAAFGNALHQALAESDYSGAQEELARSLDNALEVFGFGNLKDSDRETALHMIGDVLSAPLQPPDAPSFSFADIDRSQRVCEMEFRYSLRHSFHTGALFDLLSRHHWNIRGAEEFFSGGMMQGAIDLLFRHNGRFYLADWKSNLLERRMENFAPAALDEEMRRTGYDLQALIYTVAAKKYLSLRLGAFSQERYEQLFGGVFYCFLRGITPEHPGRGIVFRRASWELIEEMENMMG
ncbi:MAG: UvrD-helicase domain-containing protein [Victivallaceae bacterium]|nr:UvrD-helicase domain-containing protein [Victivallaceae bacterium]